MTSLFKLKSIEPINFAALVRPTSPNTYLVCPEGFSAAEPDQEAPIFADNLATVIKAWETVVGEQPRMTEVEDLRTEGPQRTYVQRTALMGYPDIITVQVIDMDDDHTSLALYSRSQYGYSDMGTNKRRITTMAVDKKCLRSFQSAADESNKRKYASLTNSVAWKVMVWFSCLRMLPAKDRNSR